MVIIYFNVFLYGNLIQCIFFKKIDIPKILNFETIYRIKIVKLINIRTKDLLNKNCTLII